MGIQLQTTRGLPNCGVHIWVIQYNQTKLQFVWRWSRSAGKLKILRTLTITRMQLPTLQLVKALQMPCKTTPMIGKTNGI